MTTTMTAATMTARAAQRASDEHVHIFAVKGVEGLFSTKSKSEPGQRYFLAITDGWIGCGCKGFQFRLSCKHSAALLKRCAREGVEARLPMPKAAKPVSQPVDDCVADLYPCECSRCRK